METSLTTMVENVESTEDGVMMGILIIEGCGYLTTNHMNHSGSLRVKLNISC